MAQPPANRAKPETSSITILSWNLAMFERSADSPTYWGHADIEAAVRDVVLDLKPDVVLFQELPGLVPFVETHDMIRSNPRSHSGNLAVLVSHQLMATKPTHVEIKRTALLATFDHLDLTLANVHLAPGRGGAEQRREQLSAVVGANRSSSLVVAGDTNTRLEEEESLAALCLSCPRPPAPTWDGHRNRFRADSARFRAYFTRAFALGDAAIADQRVLDDRPLVVDDQRFFLSDHFALLITVEIGRPDHHSPTPESH